MKKFDYSFFQNIECEYFPCHKESNTETFNCLFCYCPLNHMENCPGNPKFIQVDGKTIKDCTECTFPHESDNYDVIMKILSKQL